MRRKKKKKKKELKKKTGKKTLKSIMILDHEVIQHKFCPCSKESLFKKLRREKKHRKEKLKLDVTLYLFNP